MGHAIACRFGYPFLITLCHAIAWHYTIIEFATQDIAQKMEIRPRTVEAIKDRLMERFGSKNTAGLELFAVKNNLVD